MNIFLNTDYTTFLLVIFFIILIFDFKFSSNKRKFKRLSKHNLKLRKDFIREKADYFNDSEPLKVYFKGNFVDKKDVNWEIRLTDKIGNAPNIMLSNQYYKIWKDL